MNGFGDVVAVLDTEGGVEEDDLVLFNYRNALATMFKAIGSASVPDYILFGSEGMREKLKDRRFGSALAKKAYNLLRSARIIGIPSKLYLDVHSKWDRVLCEEAGFTFIPPSVAGRFPERPRLECLEICSHAMKRANDTPFPGDRLPFEVTYFGYGADGSGTPYLDKEMVAFRTDAETAQRLINVGLLGSLISSNGYCVEFFTGNDIGREGAPAMTFLSVTHDPNSFSDWHGYNKGLVDIEREEAKGIPIEQVKVDLTPLVICDLIDHVNGFVDLREPAAHPKRSKKAWRLERKKVGVSKGEPPPHFYRYNLRSEPHSEGGGGKKRRDLTYRTDVRGHERLLVRRGELPIPPEKYDYYMKNGFTVYQANAPHSLGHISASLFAKGHQNKQPNEWMAVKRIWIKHHMNSNDEALPYRQKLTIAGERT